MKYKIRRQVWLPFITLGIACFAAQPAAAGFCVVGGYGTSSLTRSQVADIYLGRSTSRGRFAAADWPSSSSNFAEFYAKVLHWSPNQVNGYRSQQVFGGGAGATQTIYSAAEAAEWALSGAGRIAYVNPAQLSSAQSAGLHFLYCDGASPYSVRPTSVKHHHQVTAKSKNNKKKKAASKLAAKKAAAEKAAAEKAVAGKSAVDNASAEKSAVNTSLNKQVAALKQQQAAWAKKMAALSKAKLEFNSQKKQWLAKYKAQKKQVSVDVLQAQQQAEKNLQEINDKIKKRTSVLSAQLKEKQKLADLDAQIDKQKQSLYKQRQALSKLNDLNKKVQIERNLLLFQKQMAAKLTSKNSSMQEKYSQLMLEKQQTEADRAAAMNNLKSLNNKLQIANSSLEYKRSALAASEAQASKQHALAGQAEQAKLNALSAKENNSSSNTERQAQRTLQVGKATIKSTNSGSGSNLPAVPNYFKAITDDADQSSAAGKGGGAWGDIASRLSLNVSNQRVQQQIVWFVKHPSYLHTAIQQATPFIAYVDQQVKARHMPAEAALLPVVESQFSPFAYSNKGATGLWQLMPEVAQGYSLSVNWWYDGRADFLQSTDAALDFLCVTHARFHSWYLSFAAYNCGAGRVAKARSFSLKQYHRGDYWSLNLPQETMNYVPKLLAIAYLVEHHEQYHIALPYVPTTPYFKSVSVQDQITLDQAAQLADIPLGLLHTLNPGFVRFATPPGQTSSLLLPAKNIQIFKKNLAIYNKTKHPHWDYINVDKAISIDDIAHNHNISASLLRQLNGLSGSTVLPGSSLLIPTGNASAAMSDNAVVFSAESSGAVATKSNSGVSASTDSAAAAPKTNVSGTPAEVAATSASGSSGSEKSDDTSASGSAGSEKSDYTSATSDKSDNSSAAGNAADEKSADSKPAPSSQFQQMLGQLYSGK